MKKINNERIALFLQALEVSGYSRIGMEAACHHSAVEVNDWQTIQAAMLRAACNSRVDRGCESREQNDNAMPDPI